MKDTIQQIINNKYTQRNKKFEKLYKTLNTYMESEELSIVLCLSNMNMLEARHLPEHIRLEVIPKLRLKHLKWGYQVVYCLLFVVVIIYCLLFVIVYCLLFDICCYCLLFIVCLLFAVCYLLLLFVCCLFTVSLLFPIFPQNLLYFFSTL